MGMNVILLAAAAPVTGGWTPAWGIVMVVCNIAAIALGKATMRSPGTGTALPSAEFFGGMGWPALLATTSLGHIFGIGSILGLSSMGII
ncbi:MAG: photosystem I reaction center subunit PsaK [Merismopedia sp. SIO2A8]|nr:photosystem I reaction center subunit PsaK [Symploca sp. SIO2B6]NET52650.1 photosystem I reaction center subunit PsaK [Merismopedia sp. SIO2A8]